MSRAWDALTDAQRAALLVAGQSSFGERMIDVRVDGVPVELRDHVDPRVAEPMQRAAWGVVLALVEAAEPFDVPERAAQMGEAAVASAIERARRRWVEEPGRPIGMPTETRTSVHEGDRLAFGPVKRLDGHDWRLCCGVWWSTTAWSIPGPGHGATLDGRCGKCSVFLHSGERRRGAYVPDDESTPEGKKEYEAVAVERLRETEEGDWLRGERAVVPACAGGMPGVARVNFQPLEVFVATHLAISSGCTSVLQIREFCVHRRMVLVGPLPADLFATRVPDDVRRPVDRGGRLAREPVVMYPTMNAYVLLENRALCPVEVDAALFGRYPRITDPTYPR